LNIAALSLPVLLGLGVTASAADKLEVEDLVGDGSLPGPTLHLISDAVRAAALKRSGEPRLEVLARSRRPRGLSNRRAIWSGRWRGRRSFSSVANTRTSRGATTRRCG
jgi:hypothetical protein